MEQVTARVRDFFRPRYLRRFMAKGDPAPMGFVLAGYSAGASSAEIWSLEMAGSSVDGPRMVFGQEHSDGLTWEGQGAAIARLVRGMEPELLKHLGGLGLSPEELTMRGQMPLWHAAMPMQDAIDLVRYLVEVVVGYVRFAPGALTVASPIDIAAITAHDGFQWVERKQWSNRALNLPQIASSTENGAW
jgi:hypothetical protein